MMYINLKHGPLLLDDEDYDDIKNHNWVSYCVSGGHYAKTDAYNEQGKRSTIHAHRLLLKIEQGNRHIAVKFKDGNGLNCQKSNLVITKLTGERFFKIDGARGVSKTKGVYLDKDQKSWRAVLVIDGKHKRVGTFPTIEEARIAYIDAMIKYCKDNKNIKISCR